MGFLFRPIMLLSLFFLFLQETPEEAECFGHNHCSISSTSSRAMKKQGQKCNFFRGKWVYDPHSTLYNSDCPFIDPQVNCIQNGRTDMMFLNYRWQPSSCNLPRFNVVGFFKRWRGKKIMFVGDSLSLNQFQSLTCMILAGVPNAKYTLVKQNSFTSVTFLEYGVMVWLYRTPYIVDMERRNGVGSVLVLDSISHGRAWKDMDALIFNTWHWWTHVGNAQPWDYVEEGGKYYRDMNRFIAYYKGLNTWARWVNANVDPSKTKVFFQGVSPTHYQGKDWNKPWESCQAQKVPFSGHRYPAGIPMASVIVNKVLSRIKKPVTLLDITTLSEYRMDAHPSFYGRAGHLDCSHWCLPGLPDTWNLFLYAFLT